MKKQTSTPVNIFASAPVVGKPSKKKGDREEFDLGDNLDLLASFAVLEKLLKSEAELVKAGIKEAVITHFADEGKAHAKKPDSFVGVGDRSTASCELRRNGSNRPLTPDVLELLDKYGVEYGENEIIPARFVFNPDLDQVTLEHLSKIITTDPVLKDKNIVMRQEEKKTYIVEDKTLDQVAKLPVADQKLLLEKVATIAIGKFTLDDAKIEDNKTVTVDAKATAISILQGIGVLPKPEVVATKQRTKKA